MTVRSPGRILSSVVLALMFRELKTRFASSPWGTVGTFVQPASRVLFFTFLLGVHGRRSMPGIEFPLFLLLGFVPFDFFSRCFVGMSNVIEASNPLLVYKQVKPMNVILTRVLVEFATHLGAFVLMLTGFAWFGMDILPTDPIGAMAAIVLLMGFCLGVAVLVAILCFLVPLSRLVLKHAARPMFWLSCLMYPLAMVPGSAQPYFLMNPIVQYLELLRMSWFYAYPTSGASFIFAGCATLFSLVAAAAMYRRYRRLLPRC